MTGEIKTAVVFAEKITAHYDVDNNRIWWEGEHPFDYTFSTKEVATIAWMEALLH